MAVLQFLEETGQLLVFLGHLLELLALIALCGLFHGAEPLIGDLTEANQVGGILGNVGHLGADDPDLVAIAIVPEGGLLVLAGDSAGEDDVVVLGVVEGEVGGQVGELHVLAVFVQHLHPSILGDRLEVFELPHRLANQRDVRGRATARGDPRVGF